MKWTKVILGCAAGMVILLCSAVLLARHLSRPSWTEFSSAAGKFSVLMLGQPREEEAEAGKVRSYQCQTPAHVSYLVVCVEVSDEALKKNAPDSSGKFLDDACVGLEEKFKGKSPVARKISLGDYPGREVEIATPNDTCYRVRVFLARNRYYQVVTQGPNEAVHSDEAARFFDSFKLTS